VLILDFSDPATLYPWGIGAVLVCIAWKLGSLPPRVASIVGVLLPMAFLIMWGWMVFVLFIPLLGPLDLQKIGSPPR
jgi:hypothetical protein